MVNNKRAKKKLLSDEGLKVLGNNHSYKRRKWILDTLAVIFISAIIIIFLVFVHQLIANTITRKAVVDLIAKNIVGIVFFALAMFGISKRD